MSSGQQLVTRGNNQRKIVDNCDEIEDIIFKHLYIVSLKHSTASYIKCKDSKEVIKTWRSKT